MKALCDIVLAYQRVRRLILEKQTDVLPTPFHACSIMDTATSVMTSPQPAESLQQLFGATLESNPLLAFLSGESMDDDGSKAQQAWEAQQWREHQKALAARQRQMEEPASECSTAASPVEHYQAPSFVPPVRPVSAPRLADALAAAAAANAPRSPAAETLTSPAVANNIVPGPGMLARPLTGLVEGPGLSYASADEEPVVEQKPVAAAGPANLTGIWIKDAEESQLDKYDKVLDLWQASFECLRHFSSRYFCASVIR